MEAEFGVAEIIQIVGIIAVLLLNLFQSFKMDHFKSECMDCSIELTGVGDIKK